MKDSRTAAAIATAVTALLILVLLLTGRLSLSASQWPPTPPPATELTEVEEEFVDFFAPSPVHSNPSPAYKAEAAVNESHAAEPGGTDLENAGAAPEPTQTVTARRESELKAREEERRLREAAAKAEKDEKARREARKNISNAFAESGEAPDNTASKGDTGGESGNPDGSASDLNGTGMGTVGGGWIMPRYAKVDSRQTGSIILEAIVDSRGKVISVSLIGGKAPASATPALVERCKSEIRRHTFTRNDDRAPERSVARITYSFR